MTARRLQADLFETPLVLDAVHHCNQLGVGVLTVRLDVEAVQVAGGKDEPGNQDDQRQCDNHDEAPPFSVGHASEW